MPSFLKKNKNLVILILLIFSQMVLISVQVPKGTEGTYFETFIFSIFSPIQNGVVFLYKGIGRVWNDYFYLIEVKQQNRKLLTEVTRLRQENIVLRNILKKYEKEENIKNFITDISKNFVNARIIGFDMSNLFKSVVINKGRSQGLKKDMVVLDDRGNLVGRIVAPISNHQATVQLITDNKSGVSVVKQGGSSIGILSGNNTETCEMKYILSTDEEVNTGNTIVTTGHDGIFPPDLQVGKVFSVKRTHEMFKEIKVSPFFRIDQLHQVVVLRVDTKEIF